jgi:hypothetical protein
MEKVWIFFENSMEIQFSYQCHFHTIGIFQSEKFATRSRDLGCAVLMSPMSLLLDFHHLGRAISKLFSLGYIMEIV